MEKILYTSKQKHCTKKDLIDAMSDMKDDDLILLSDNQYFYTIREIANSEGDIVLRPSKETY